MKGLSKDELMNLYETLPEDTLRKLDIYDKAKEAYEEKQKMEKLKNERIEKAIALVKEAQELLSIYRLQLRVSSVKGIQIIDENKYNLHSEQQRKIGKIQFGVKTHQSKYRLPILQALTELGGRGDTNEILERVYEKMKDVLVSFDLEKLSTGIPRWNNTANWERLKMIKDGLLKNDSPRGIWEITEKGEIYLKEHLNE